MNFRVALACVYVVTVAGFAVLPTTSVLRGARHASAVTMNAQPPVEMGPRRKFLRLSGAAALGTVLVGPGLAHAGLDGQPEIDWYRPESVTNGKYSGQEWTGPVWAAPEGEESITWKQFVSAMQSKDVTVVDFVGKSGDKVYATLKSKQNARIRVGEGLPDETTPPPLKPDCEACLKACPPERMDCSCLSTCGGKKDWNSPLYTAKVVRALKVPFRYSQGEDQAYNNPFNKAKRFMMFDGPMSAGVV